jgi:hypothetical protein
MMNVQAMSVLCLAMLLIGSSTGVKAEDADIVRVKIGIRIRGEDGQERWAKTRDTVASGDRYRLYVAPETIAYAYALYIGAGGIVEPLGDRRYIDVPVLAFPVGVWPSIRELYRVDASGPQERIVTICSPAALPAVEQIVKAGQVGLDVWEPLEQQLRDASAIDLSRRVEKPWDIAASVRGQHQELYVWLHAELPTYSGNTLVIKQYEFRIRP